MVWYAWASVPQGGVPSQSRLSLGEHGQLTGTVATDDVWGVRVGDGCESTTNDDGEMEPRTKDGIPFCPCGQDADTVGKTKPHEGGAEFRAFRRTPPTVRAR